MTLIEGNLVVQELSFLAIKTSILFGIYDVLISVICFINCESLFYEVASCLLDNNKYFMFYQWISWMKFSSSKKHSIIVLE